ncbi:MAG: type II toxin-antitoxin system VapC family toxin [Pseudonocardia sp.]|nr:type II toxin-antitoxin system VapC family toxin [Pseudonocardia sp.]
MSAFADSSALVKLYADEDGQAAVRHLEPLVISALARVEVPAALWRKHRIGEIAPEDASTLVTEFEADYFGTPDEDPRFAVVALTPGIMEAAARFTAVHGLRAYDAVQLASAVAAVAADPDCTTFAAFDKSLRVATLAEGMTVSP